MTKTVGTSEQTLQYEESMKPEGDLHFLIVPFPLLGNRGEEKKVLYFPPNILPGMSGIDNTNAKGNNG